MTQVIRLFTGPDCELCDQAKELIYPLLSESLRLDEIDATQSLETKKAYGLRIPVVVTDDGKELGWPFSFEQLQQLLHEAGC